jgi:hypothetical protein
MTGFSIESESCKSTHLSSGLILQQRQQHVFAWPSGLGRVPLASSTKSQRARVQSPGQARPTKPSIPPGSVNW